MTEPTDRPCCYIDEDASILDPDGWTIGQKPCKETAQWVIVHGPAVDDYTEACTEHVGALLTDAPEHRIYPIKEET